MTLDRQSSTATCYRHPNREAPLSCTRCGRPICLDDAIDAPVGYLCPECAQQPARVRRVARRTGRAAGTNVTIALLVIMGIVFLVEQSAGNAFISRFALWGPGVRAGQWWRIITGAFLHANLLHIGFNGYLLYLLGQMMEPGLGSSRFGAVFAAGLLGGSLGALLMSWGAATIGASGAVFGLMGAAMVGERRAGINPWKSSIGILVIINLVFTFVVSGISIGGHIGGLVAGALAGVPIFHLHGRQRTLGTVLAWALAAALGVGAILAGTLGPLF